MADANNITKYAEIVRRLVTFYVVDKETRAAIADMTDDEILNYADETLTAAEGKNDAFISKLKEEQ